MSGYRSRLELSTLARYQIQIQGRLDTGRVDYLVESAIGLFWTGEIYSRIRWICQRPDSGCGDGCNNN
jgi:hypothetical protein